MVVVSLNWPQKNLEIGIQKKLDFLTDMNMLIGLQISHVKKT